MSTADTRLKDAAAFFTLFTDSAWKSCHLRTAELEIFVSRDLGERNPMIGGMAEPEAPSEPTASTATLLRSSHLGTLLTLADVDEPLAAGQVYAQLDLLGETIDLLAEAGGAVTERLLSVGALVEFDQPLLRLR